MPGFNFRTCFLIFLIVMVMAAASHSSPAADDTSRTGKWKVSKLEGAPVGAGGIYDDLKSGTINLHPDHTYRLWNSAIGGLSGTWKLSGSNLVLTTDDDSTSLAIKTKTLHLRGNQLADPGDPLTVVYDRLPADTDTDTGKPMKVFSGHKDFIESLSVSSDGSTLFTTDMPGVNKQWNLGNGK